MINLAERHQSYILHSAPAHSVASRRGAGDPRETEIVVTGFGRSQSSMERDEDLDKWLPAYGCSGSEGNTWWVVGPGC